MRIKFCGAARTVTGSQHLLSINGKHVLLECGLYQGRRAEAREKNQSFLFEPDQVETLVLSHAHIDHSGNIPSLVKHGFQGNIIATRATVSLCHVMLRDSAYLQEKDAEWLRKKREEEIEPLYTIEDAELALQQFMGVEYGRPFSVAPGVRATFHDAGHILGSAGAVFEIEEKGRRLRLGFSGDLGRFRMPILRDPVLLDDLDVLIMESTYGDRVHHEIEDVEEELAGIVRTVHRRGGKIIIPAFAVGRTQMLVYYLHKLWQHNRIPELPIYVDSPLAVDATAVFRMHPECFDRETYRLFLQDGQDPFGFRRLTYVRDVEDSKKLNDLTTSAIIISASGMAEAGRILHHLRNHIGKPENLVLLVGFMAEHTLGRKLGDGATEVKIFGEVCERRCEVRKLEGLSAHADREQLLALVQRQNPKRLQQIFLVHGEPDPAAALADRIRAAGYGGVHVPSPGEEFTV
ncbi:MAG: Ribonuclease [bacterium]|nr:Ribonuclease [bacterium]MCK6559222.1 MBL fold metallo-hydrolase [bacterium]NUM64404.1 MBL fold metallo-hydrolase [candidate division KSB1 bacterium]